jgi:hypothetical protein
MDVETTVDEHTVTVDARETVEIGLNDAREADAPALARVLRAAGPRGGYDTRSVLYVADGLAKIGAATGVGDRPDDGRPIPLPQASGTPARMLARVSPGRPARRRSRRAADLFRSTVGAPPDDLQCVRTRKPARGAVAAPKSGTPETAPHATPIAGRTDTPRTPARGAAGRNLFRRRASSHVRGVPPRDSEKDQPWNSRPLIVSSSRRRA